MADLADPATQQLLRTVIREEFQSDELRRVIREETEDIRADMASLKEDVAIIRYAQGNHGMMLRSLQSDVGGLKTGFRHLTIETQRLGGLLEDLDDRFKGSAELYG